MFVPPRPTNHSLRRVVLMYPYNWQPGLAARAVSDRLSEVCGQFSVGIFSR